MDNKGKMFADWKIALTASDLEMIDVVASSIEPDYYSEQAGCSLTAIDSAIHYHFDGFKRGLDPRKDFDTAYYLSRSPDVVLAGINPLYHFLLWGEKEGRYTHPGQTSLSPLMVSMQEVYRVVEDEFDRDYYLKTYIDVKENHVDPVRHFIWFGWRMGRNPNKNFDTNFYLNANCDVAKADTNPFYHYLCWGRIEGRRANSEEKIIKLELGDSALSQLLSQHFDLGFYRENYLRDLDTDPIRHYIAFGWRDNNDPSSEFSTRRYRDNHPGRNWEANCPLIHYLKSKRMLELYENILKMEGETIELCILAIDGCLDSSNTTLALDWLKRSKNAVGGHFQFRQCVRNTVDVIFKDAWTAAENLYRLAARGQADAILTSAASLIAETWQTCDPIGFHLPRQATKRVSMLANIDLRQCTFYRVEQKIELFSRLGYELEVYPQDKVESFLDSLSGVELALFYRLPAMPMNIRAIQTATAMGVPTIYDIDDLIFDERFYPEPFQTYGDVTKEFYCSLQLGVPLFRFAMSLCDYGIASTSALASHMAACVKSGRVYVLKNGLDKRTEHLLSRMVSRTRRDDGLILFYGSGTKAHKADFTDLAAGAIADILEEYPSSRLIVAGYISLSGRLLNYRNQILIYDWLPNVNDYWCLLAEADINLAVLDRHETTDAKSEIKWMEAALFGVPSIVSPTHRYQEVLSDGEDVYFARSSEEWAQALKVLAERPQERRRIAKNALVKIRNCYVAQQLSEDLAKIIADFPIEIEPQPRKKRVLLVNIFFPPQTIGGSTRVTRDNLDYFLSAADSNIFDFGVVCSDNDSSDPYHLRVEDYRGCPVFRISPGENANLEWNPYDSEVGGLFRHVLKVFAPDLVHFHCPQRLTGSIIEETQIAGIRYIVTVHDAWWVSDYHFLVDQRGVLHEPFQPIPSYPPPPVSIGQSLDRRRYLQSLLLASQEILSVSEAFTRIYQDCGYLRTRTVANGTPPLAYAKRSSSMTSKVRLAHIGSMTHHKGYFLLKEVLTSSNYCNIELTVVDHARFGGDAVRSKFGGTDVIFEGKIKQESMHQFYAGFDVLAAPSIWPESFGLVTREALAAGLWVLASDRGAIGDSITAGLNGWCVDVGDGKALRQVLGEIDSHPSVYKSSPPQDLLPQRLSSDQGAELLSIYKSVMTSSMHELQIFCISGRKRVEPKFLRDTLSMVE